MKNMEINIVSNMKLNGNINDINDDDLKELHKQQRWSLYKIKHRIFPNIFNNTTFIGISLPVVMGFWYYFRQITKKQNSKLASLLVKKEFNKLFEMTLNIALTSIGASIFSKLMSIITNKFGLNIRNNLVKYYENKYLLLNPYKLKERLKFPSQRITNDIEKFSESFANLYYSLLWCFGGVIVLSFGLINKMGIKQYCMSIGYSIVSRQLITIISPSFSDLIELIQLNEINYKGIHSIIDEYIEEIQIFGGGNIELNILNNSFNNIINSLNNYYYSNMITDIFGSYFTGELGNLVGYISIVPSIYYNYNKNDDTIEHLTSIVLELSFLTRLFEKVFKILKQVSEVNGYAHRILEIENAINDIELNQHAYSPSMSKLKNIQSIELKNITINTPNNITLIKNLSFKVNVGQHLFIEGPNGSGKTSIFRIICGLWEPYNNIGQIIIPDKQTDIYFLSQRPYIVPTLNIKEQLIYPSQNQNRFDDETIVNILKFVQLYDTLLLRSKDNNIFDADILKGLSGGECQRIGMARILLHKPLFALLDECTSAVSKDMKNIFFQECIKLNITLITIAHDMELKKYHKKTLKIDKNSWKIEDV